MVSEITINRLENVLTEVIDFSGTKEQTTIISNMEVVNAAPTGLSGFVTIKDDRDGDTILASKVPGVIYANGDLVNVLFIDGTEPIAFQQASASGGDPVAVSKLVSPDLLIDPVISADNSGDVTLAGTGDLILPDDIIHSGDTDTLISLEDDKIVFQAGSLEMVSIIEAATDEVVINDAAGDINFRIEAVGEPNALFVQGSDGLVGIKTGAPEVELHLLNTGTEGVPATLGRTTMILQNSAAAGNFTAMAIIAGNTGRSIIDCGDTDDIDVGSFQYHHNDNSFRFFVNAGTEGLRINSSGDVSTGNVAPLAQLHVDQASTTAAEPVLLLDQADVSEEFIKFVGTAAAATLTQSLVDEGDVTTATRIGWYKINVDDIGNQITDGDYWVPFYSLV